MGHGFELQKASLASHSIQLLFRQAQVLRCFLPKISVGEEVRPGSWAPGKLDRKMLFAQRTQELLPVSHIFYGFKVGRIKRRRLICVRQRRALLRVYPEFAS